MFDHRVIIPRITAVQNGETIEGCELVEDGIVLRASNFVYDLDYAHDLQLLLLECLPPPRKMRYEVTPGRDHFHIAIVPMG